MLARLIACLPISLSVSQLTRSARGESLMHFLTEKRGSRPVIQAIERFASEIQGKPNVSRCGLLVYPVCLKTP